MSEIHSIRLPDLRVAGLLQLLSDIDTSIGNVVTAAADRALIQPEQAALAAARAPMDARYATPAGSLTTPVIQLADLRRDDAITLIGGVTRAQVRSSNPARKAAAQRILHYFDSYGNIADKAYPDETAAISALLQDLATTLNADVNTLGLTADVLELKLANDAFNLAYGTRNAERPNGGDAPNLTELRPAAETAFKKLMERIEDVLGFTRGAAPWPALVGVINNIIDRYRAVLDRRNGGDNEDNTPTPPAI